MLTRGSSSRDGAVIADWPHNRLTCNRLKEGSPAELVARLPPYSPCRHLVSNHLNWIYNSKMAAAGKGWRAPVASRLPLPWLVSSGSPVRSAPGDGFCFWLLERRISNWKVQGPALGVKVLSKRRDKSARDWHTLPRSRPCPWRRHRRKQRIASHGIDRAARADLQHPRL